MKYLIALLVWPVALAAIPAKDILFGGQIRVWPFLLAACALTSLVNWRAALILALGVGGAQITERLMVEPEVYQLGIYATLGFIALGLFDIVAGITASVVAILYFMAARGDVEWRLAMIVSEVGLVAGMSAAVLNGPSGGIFQRMVSADTARLAPLRAAVSSSGRFRFIRWFGLGGS